MIAPVDLLQNFPAEPSQLDFVSQTREEIKAILDGRDERLLIIVGPCSIHHVSSAMAYAEKLKQLARDVSDSILLVMRTYFEKPRTVLGWKGFLYDPHLNGSHDFQQGLQLTRQLLLTLATLKVPTAMEFLSPMIVPYLSDLISWGSIGARTAASPIHRQLASGLPMPVGIKNCTSGNIDTAINGVLAASHEHYHLDLSLKGHPHFIQTEGNSYAHVVLRGGESQPNFDAKSIRYTLNSLEKIHLPPRLLVDCSHGNSRRNYRNQVSVFQTVLQSIQEGNKAIKGFMLESHIKAGNQPYDCQSGIDPEISITDPCLAWEETDQLIRCAANKLNSEKLVHA